MAEKLLIEQAGMSHRDRDAAGIILPRRANRGVVVLVVEDGCRSHVTGSMIYLLVVRASPLLGRRMIVLLPYLAWGGRSLGDSGESRVAPEHIKHALNLAEHISSRHPTCGASRYLSGGLCAERACMEISPRARNSAFISLPALLLQHCCCVCSVNHNTACNTQKVPSPYLVFVPSKHGAPISGT